MDESKFIEILNIELIKALGCTEPIIITYATALATKYTNSELKTKVNVIASSNLIKNAMSVTIPGINSKNNIQFSSVLLAAALGLIKPEIEKKLEILSNVTKQDIENAKELISEGLITIELSDSKSKLYLEVIVKTTNSEARVIIEGSHTNVTLVEVNGKIITEKSGQIEHTGSIDTSFMNINSIWEFVQNVEISKLGLIEKSININKRICQEGLRNSYGLRVGQNIKANMQTEFFSDDIISHAVSLTAAGSDARMSGCALPAMSNSGSGNQGISTTIPVVAVAERLEISEEKLIRAVTLSNLITIYIKSQLGRLSPVCGATVSATGACCGITYLLGGKKQDIESSIQIILGNISGMICDGAKSGCALKIATCTYAAVQSALLIIDGTTIPSKEGLLGENPEKTIENFSNITNEGMIEADRLILDIMLEKIGVNIE